ncbi:MAG: helix-turn-helix transcriptional regulator [Hymenobacter sp.]|nr:helix-turn-helix transcriptional regulator [Hymenobacter sp.]
MPQQLLALPTQHRSFDLDGCTVMESCHHEPSVQGSAYVAEHELIYLRSGRITLQVEGQAVQLGAGETALLKRGSYIHYRKQGSTESEPYESVLFFLQNRFVEEFLKMQQLPRPRRQALPLLATIPAHPLLRNFAESLLPYFGSGLAGNAALVRVKTFEFLLNLAEVAPALLGYFFELTHVDKTDLVRVMEQNCTRNLPLAEFAYLSGRSLSTFKRDFARLFATSPHRWLLGKRLQLAHYLLENTDKTVADAAWESGFEDLSHFSKAFRRHFGFAPSQTKAVSQTVHTVQPREPHPHPPSQGEGSRAASTWFVKPL